eukprot:TRINITY_DN2576_c0_g1_i6.p1 TRINITY_DN2576_c0_g1~~TRINITY_DN2576_c0_g1_i6.p1  ORF type:complete len:346 (+),score=48.91 TRINITY_DN2576_c0_g1_i6:1134-2171(+)
MGMATAKALSFPTVFLPPLVVAFSYVGVMWAADFVYLIGIVIIMNSILSGLTFQSYILFTLSNNGLFFPLFSQLNSQESPTFAILGTCVFSGFLALFVDFHLLGSSIYAGALICYSLIALGLILERYRQVPSHLILSANRYTSEGIILSQSCEETIQDKGKFSRFPEYQILETITRFVSSWLKVFLFFFCVSSIMIGCKLRFDWPWGVFATFVLLNFVIYGCLQLLRPLNLPQTFKCPLVPLIPLFSLCLNLIILVQASNVAIGGVMVWLFVGVFFYFSYGIQQQQETINRTSQSNNSTTEGNTSNTSRTHGSVTDSSPSPGLVFHEEPPFSDSHRASMESESYM